MVSAQDYNVFPLSQSSNILKLKATNRTHAGHSRYIDINDPTGTFQSVETYTEDGFLYKDDDPLTKSITVSDNNTPAEVVDNTIVTYLKEQRLNNVTLSYDIPVDKIKMLERFNIYVAGQNLVTWTNYSGYNPEVSSFLYNGLINGVDWNSAPNAKTFLLGVNINF